MGIEKISTESLAKVPAEFYESKNLSLIPAKIEDILPSAILDSEQKPEYLLAICQDNGLSLKELYNLISIKKIYKTNLSTIVDLVKEKYNSEEINQLYLIKQFFLGESGSGVSFRSLSKFCRRFNLRPDADYLIGILSDAHKRLENKYITTTIDQILKQADKIPTITLEATLDFLANDVSYRVEDKNEH